MKRTFIVTVLVALMSGCSAPDTGQSVPSKAILSYYTTQIDSLAWAIDGLSVAARSSDEKQIQHEFDKARKYWKRMEPLTEYYFANVSEAINGPALPEEEDYDAKMIEPMGFQVIEELIFPFDTTSRNDLLQQIGILNATVPRLRQLYESVELTDVNIVEATRLELLRIISLGISGFDSPVAQHSIVEVRHALQGIYNIVSAYPDNREKQKLQARLDEADRYLGQPWTFDSFDRATFIRSHLTPLSEALYDYQRSIGVPNNKWIRPIDMSKTNFADASIFNERYFSPVYTQDLEAGEDMRALGHMLFFDPILSGNNTRACASCHQPEKAFTDGAVKSTAFGANGKVFRNAPTLVNAAFQKAQFSDSRVAYLEDQITDVMHNPSEMNGNIHTAVEKVRSSTTYASLFARAFKQQQPAKAVSGRNIQVALATYVRSLRGMNSRFDQFMRGENTLDAAEIHGFNLFMGKAKCGTCHFMPLFNGSVPPSYVETESEVLGVPARRDTTGATVDGDDGKILVSKKPTQKNMFKTSTVRNAALTAPYMHNGVFTTLEEVIDFYNRGGGAGIGVELDNQTLPPDALHLSVEEREHLIRFIGALTDTTGLGARPASLPMTGDASVDKRKVGGEY